MRVTMDYFIGKTIEGINGFAKDSDRISFLFTDGTQCIMYHLQDCCEHVAVEDISGDIDDLQGQVILSAGEFTNEQGKEYGDHNTWTFYVLRTVKGTVVIRWWGSSNGYYSEDVFIELIK